MQELKNILNSLRDERILKSSSDSDFDEFDQGVIYGLTIAIHNIKNLEGKENGK